ncbi:MAG: PAS domain-containing protein [Anaeromyxobacteraceae bacterium]|nr:PAS domain-containing protein [Anaeromyxobacteraceae bacterium]
MDFVHPEDVAATLAEVQKLASGTPSVRFVNRFRTTDGIYRTLLWSTKPDPSTGLLYPTARDVMEQRERELTAEGQYRHPGPLPLRRVGGPAPARGLGEPAQGEPASGRCASGQGRTIIEERIRKLLEAGAAEVEAALLSKDGRRTPRYLVGVRFALDGVPCSLTTGIDLSARRNLEEQLRQSQKSEGSASSRAAWRTTSTTCWA